jgi:nucleotide-binding universal stress UspA family protein
MFKRIVVGVDGRAGGRDALALGAALQRAAGGELVAVHVYTYDRTVPLADADAAEAGLKEDLLTKLESDLRAVGVSARTVIARDLAPARALQAAAEREGADLVVIGSCHRAGMDRVLTGDDAARTLHGSPCAVAVAPHGYAEQPHRLSLIGVGYDGSHESHRALQLACDLAERAGAYVRATMVVHPGGGHAGQERLEHAIAEFGDRVTPEVAVGKSWHALASSSSDLDLLVVGSRGYGPLRRVVLGSTSTHLLREAACPVLVVSRDAMAPEATTDPGAGDRHARRVSVSR